ncbi:MAG: transketolase family protein, partial [Spirochaetes bacterium]|nr:transketolase family protein [Spirochaetota bacterium]
KNKEIVALDADLSKSTRSEIFAKKFPDRFFEMGIQEANMIGTASGLSYVGKIPFICSFAVFLTGRYDQIRLSIAYSQANVKLIGTHAGLGVGEDGNSQMALEDLSLMRSLPNMVVMQPVDDIETKEAIKFAVEHKGPVYFRLTRQKVPAINKADYKFQPGKGVLLKDGKDGTLFVTGAMVSYALEAAKELEKDNINLRVINIHTIKPIDRDIIIESARINSNIMTIEDHNIIGGLGTAVAEVLAENQCGKLYRLGLNDIFGESGTADELYRKYKLDKEGIKETVLSFIKT